MRITLTARARWPGTGLRVLAEEVSSSDLTVGESILTADKWRCPR